MAYETAKVSIQQKRTLFPCGCRLVTHRWKVPAGFDLALDVPEPTHLIAVCQPAHRLEMLERLGRRYGPDVLARIYDPDFPR